MFQAPSFLENFFFPKLDARLLKRLAFLVVFCLLFFGFVCRPCVIQGESMRPTYGGFGFTFCWKPIYWVTKPKRGDVAILRMVGNKVLLLKRIIALEGDTVEFRDGQLYLNGEKAEEPWDTLGPCNWNLPPRKVEPGHVYVVGDNRSMDIDEHIFGQIPASRILGMPLW